METNFLPTTITNIFNLQLIAHDYVMCHFKSGTGHFKRLQYFNPSQISHNKRCGSKSDADTNWCKYFVKSINNNKCTGTSCDIIGLKAYLLQKNCNIYTTVNETYTIRERNGPSVLHIERVTIKVISYNRLYDSRLMVCGTAM